MRPVHRKRVNKHSSARRFRKNTSKTKSANMNVGLGRGGIRL